jgi:hypothetical protein
VTSYDVCETSQHSSPFKAIREGIHESRLLDATDLIATASAC